MKRLGRILVISMVLSLLVVAISPSLVAAKNRPEKLKASIPVYNLIEEAGIVMIGERDVNMALYPGTPTCQIVHMRHIINVGLYTWDFEAETPADLLVEINIDQHLKGEVYTDIWFPEEDGMVADDGIINGHTTFQWEITTYNDDLPDEIYENLEGKWNLWFEDEVELDRSTRDGEFPFPF